MFTDIKCMINGFIVVHNKMTKRKTIKNMISIPILIISFSAVISDFYNYCIFSFLLNSFKYFFTFFSID